MLECDFQERKEGYTCWILNSEITEKVLIKLLANHLPGHADEDVAAVRFTNSNLSHIPMEFFERFPNVNFLDVSLSGLPRINPFRNCENLLIINGFSNNITAIDSNVFAECRNLEMLNFRNNQISEFNSNGLENLRILNLDLNNISEITENTFRHLQNLKQLSVSYNFITEIDFSSFQLNSNLEELTLNNNMIENLIASSNPYNNLRILLLLGNEINFLDEFTFANMENLEQLDLSYNQISSLENVLWPLPNLNKVLIKDNCLSTIENGTFSNNTKLVKIDLQNNKISVIESGALDRLREINEIRLEGNDCVDENFSDLNGNIEGVLRGLNQCFPITNFDHMTCNFNEDINGYSCQIGWFEAPIFVRSVNFL